MTQKFLVDPLQFALRFLWEDLTSQRNQVCDDDIKNVYKDKSEVTVFFFFFSFFFHMHQYSKAANRF